MTGILSLGATSDLDSAIGRVPGSGADIDDARSRARTFAVMTDVLGAASFVAAGVTVYFVLSRPSDSSRVGLIVGPSSAGLTGRF